MDEGRNESQWNHTAAILCLLAEINRDRDQRSEPFTPADFHPLHHSTERERTPEEADGQLREFAAAIGAQRKP